VIRAAEENVGAEPGGDRHLPARAEIVAGEKAGARRREAVGEHRPHHHAATGGADVEPELTDRAAVDLLRPGRLGRKRAHDRLLRSDDEAHAGRDVASQHARPHSLGGRWIGACDNNERQGCCPDGITKHMDPPLARSAQTRPDRAGLRESRCYIGKPLPAAALTIKGYLAHWQTEWHGKPNG